MTTVLPLALRETPGEEYLSVGYWVMPGDTEARLQAFDKRVEEAVGGGCASKCEMHFSNIERAMIFNIEGRCDRAAVIEAVERECPFLHSVMVHDESPPDGERQEAKA